MCFASFLPSQGCRAGNAPLKVGNKSIKLTKISTNSNSSCMACISSSLTRKWNEAFWKRIRCYRLNHLHYSLVNMTSSILVPWFASPTMVRRTISLSITQSVSPINKREAFFVLDLHIYRRHVRLYMLKLK